jgi:hypothetical protein
MKWQNILLTTAGLDGRGWIFVILFGHSTNFAVGPQILRDAKPKKS